MTNPSGAHEFTPGFYCGSCYSIFSCMCMFCRSLFVLCTFSFGHCVVCSSIYGFWLPLWYLQTLPHWNVTKDFFSALFCKKQQFTGIHVAPLGHNILILSEPILLLVILCCMLNEEGSIINFIDFSLIRPGLEHTIYHTQGKHTNHCTGHRYSFQRRRCVLLW